MAHFRPVGRVGRAWEWLTADPVAVNAAPGDQTDALVPQGVTPGPGDLAWMTPVTPPSRAEAMSIPAVMRARNLIAGTIAQMPLRAWRRMAGVTAEVPPPTWTEQPDPRYTRGWIFAQTVDDLIFHGRAFWGVERRDAAGFPLAFQYLDLGRVGWHQVGPAHTLLPSAMGGGWVLTVDGTPVDPRAVVRFDGILDGGVLVHGARELRTAMALSDAARRFASMEIPAGVLQDQGAGLTTSAEIDDALDQWEASRRKRSTAYLAPGLAYQGDVAMDPERLQLIQARQQSAVEVSRLFGIPTHYEAAPSGSSMTYQNMESQRRDLVDLSLAPWIGAVEQRLSLPDVTPRGTALRFDVEAFARGTSTERWNTYQVAVNIGALTPEEVRNREAFTPPGTIAEMPAPTSAPTPEGVPA
jgi:phage portal protein BeeE